jgi:hypothetical protein
VEIRSLVCGLWFNNLSGDKYLAALFDGTCVKVATCFSFKKLRAAHISELNLLNVKSYCFLPQLLRSYINQSSRSIQKKNTSLAKSNPQPSVGRVD